jgi:hypothetical protein
MEKDKKSTCAFSIPGLSILLPLKKKFTDESGFISHPCLSAVKKSLGSRIHVEFNFDYDKENFIR